MISFEPGGFMASYLSRWEDLARGEPSGTAIKTGGVGSSTREHLNFSRDMTGQLPPANNEAGRRSPYLAAISTMTETEDEK